MGKTTIPYKYDKDGKPIPKYLYDPSLTPEQVEKRKKKAEQMRINQANAQKNGNWKGFKKNDERTKELARKGAIMSDIEKKKKKAMREVLNEMLMLSMKSGRCKSVEEIQDFASMKGMNMDLQTALLLVQVQTALEGGADGTKAFKVIADLLGETSMKIEIDSKKENKNKLDSLMLQVGSHSTYDEEDLKAMEEWEDEEIPDIEVKEVDFTEEIEEDENFEE